MARLGNEGCPLRLDLLLWRPRSCPVEELAGEEGIFPLPELNGLVAVKAAYSSSSTLIAQSPGAASEGCFVIPSLKRYGSSKRADNYG